MLRDNLRVVVEVAIGTLMVSLVEKFFLQLLVKERADTP
jgi:hypothetical protein